MIPDKQLIPPIPPLRNIKSISYGKKIFFMALMACVLMFGVLAIWVMSYSREKTNKEVAQSIVDQWGGTVHVEGPVAQRSLVNADWVPALSFNCNAEVVTKSLHRSIYEAEVFTASININGKYEKDNLLKSGDSIVLKLVVDSKQLIELGDLKFGNRTFPWHPAEYDQYAKVDLRDMPDIIEFSTNFVVKGSSGLFIKQIGKSSEITINGEAPNPSFTGSALPVERTVHDDSFSARWEARAIDTSNDNYFGFEGMYFLTGVDRYQLVDRSLKYSFIIIFLTFVSVLFVEIIRKHPIPLLNYFLIGAALIIYYSLLLSFVELISFGPAYLIASVLTVVLISGYMWKMLDSRKLGASICVILSLIYLIIYIMLNISTYALLFGSLLLFFALAAMMFASLKISADKQ